VNKQPNNNLECKDCEYSVTDHTDIFCTQVLKDRLTLFNICNIEFCNEGKLKTDKKIKLGDILLGME
jgi:hypothetical protein